MIKANISVQDRMFLLDELLQWHFDGYCKWKYSAAATIGMELMVGALRHISRDEKFVKPSFRLKCWGTLRRENPQLLAKLQPFFMTWEEERSAEDEEG